MSEQSKSNFQAFGAGLLGFVAVLAIGGGALLVRSSQQAKAGSRPVAAAEPIDLGSSMPRPSMSPASVQKERRAESPAPLMGAEDESEGAEAPAEASAAAASSPESAPPAKSPAPRLEVTQHLDKPGNGSSATAIVRNTAAPEKPAKAFSHKTLKLDPAGMAPASVASVHYGVTSRSELMGRAAGPVYNFKGKGAVGGSGATGQLADEVNAKVAEIRRQLEASGLPADQRAKLQKELDEAVKGGAKAQ
ncbi:MAG: hypothetical protein PHS14_04455 [Elusimicrobia bacterium]|nr:hypothetical protein [Elusimicrobiota bacterium]